MGPRRLNLPRIALRLAELHLTVEGFKEKVACDRRTVERLLSRKSTNPQYATVKSLADVLELQPRDILLENADTATDGSAPRARPSVALRLPVTGAYLVGRVQEMERLDRLWAGGQVNILSIVAWGGVGKSTLISHWVSALAHDGWRGATRVFGWTFSSQGIRESVTSADGFIVAALRYFGDPDPSVGTPWDKGRRLAHLVSAQRTLLLLDGLEPLQQPPGPEAGKVKDPALATLLQALALYNPGLCIITTRLAVADIAAFHGTMVDVLSLTALSEEAGAMLLQTLGVLGTDAERRAAAQEFGGHALALQLLGTYLCEACGGDVRRRYEVAELDDWSQEGGHAWRVMASYERWFGPGPEVAILRMLGLFDRMARAEELAAVRAAPPIPGLNEALIDLTAPQWVSALRRLRAAGLLALPDPKTPYALDAHPLVREYYRHQLREQYPAAWRAGHARLFIHLQASVVEACPTTLEGLLPLYAAVVHGCLAGRGPDALHVFRYRIRRGDQQSVEQLGAFGLDLAALAPFFVVRWSTVVPGVEVDDTLFLLHAAGECLSALGRVDEAVTPLQHALALACQYDSWTSAARAASKLSEVYRARGALLTALHFAEQGAAHARRPGVSLPVHVLSQTFLGFAQYWVGQSAEALTTFQEAERVQQRANPERPLLHGLLGYMYSELLLDDLDRQAGVLIPAQFAPAWCALHTRLAQALTWAHQDQLPSDLGLQHIAMARAYILAWQYPGAVEVSGGLVPYVHRRSEKLPPPDPVTAQQKATTHVTRAMEHLRLSNHRNYFPRALLARAALCRLHGDIPQGLQDVEAVLNLAQSSSMDFYQADAYLEQAALHLAAAQAAPHEDHACRAAGSLKTAKALIDKMGYYRRQRQVAELEARL